MPISTQIKPSGSFNNVGVDFIGPKTPGEDIAVVDDSLGTNEIAKFKNSNLSILTDRIDELTSANGVKVEAVRLQDGGVVAANNAWISGRNAADSADVNIVRVTAAGALDFNISGATWSPTLGASGSMTFTSTTVHYARYVQIGKFVFFYIRVSGTTGGTASTDITFTLPVDGALNHNSYLAAGYVDGGTNTAGQAYVVNTTSPDTAIVRKEDSSNWGLGAGRNIYVTGFYEIS